MTSDDIGKYDDKKQEQLNVVIKNFYHAKDQRFEKRGDRIIITYTLDGAEKQYSYDYKKGILSDGQE